MCGVFWSYKRSICLSGGAYLSNWVCVWSQRRPGGLSAGAMVYGRSIGMIDSVCSRKRVLYV